MENPMTARELAEALLQYDPDATVFVDLNLQIPITDVVHIGVKGDGFICIDID